MGEYHIRVETPEGNISEMGYKHCDFCRRGISVTGKRQLVYRLCEMCFDWSLPKRLRCGASRHERATPPPSPTKPKQRARGEKKTKPPARPRQKRKVSDDGAPPAKRTRKTAAGDAKGVKAKSPQAEGKPPMVSGKPPKDDGKPPKTRKPRVKAIVEVGS